MDKARQAVSSFISRDGKHQTDVEEDVRAAVTEEHVRPHQHENVTTAVDKEIHQDHHHTTVQPVKAQETLPEKHTHNMMPVEHKTFEHDNASDLRSTLDQDASKYKNTSVTHDASHSTTVAPTVGSEHVHHHVHEHVQPVIQKETVDPHVVHTTVPIHETHHASTVHHGTTTLPAKTLSEFQADGRGLRGKAPTKLGEYDGCPSTYNKELATSGGDHMHTTSSSSSEDTATAKNTMFSKDKSTTGRSASQSEGHGYSLGSGATASAAAATAFSNANQKSSMDSQPRTDPDMGRTTRNSTGTRRTSEGKESLVDKIVSKVGRG